MANSKPQPDALDALLARMADEELPADAQQELAMLLKSSEDNRVRFVRFCMLDEMLREEDLNLAQSHDSDFGSVLAALDDTKGEAAQPVDISDVLKQREMQARAKRAERHASFNRRFGQSGQPDGGSRTRHYVIPRPLFYGSVAAVIAVVALLIWPLLPDKAVEGKSQVVARLERVVEVVWIGDETPLLGKRLTPGEFEMSYGLAEFVFNNDARVIVEGPARFTIDSESAMTLHKGRLVGLCETDRSRGFIVGTPGGRVTDFGTEFGVDVDRAMNTEVHVFDGEVILSVKDRTGATRQENLRRNDAAKVVSGSKSIERIESSASKFFRNVVSQYELAIRKSKPLMYYRCGEDADANLLRDYGVHGLHGKVRSVQFGRRGAIEGDDDRAMLFYKEEDRIVIDRDNYLDMPGTDFTRNFSVEAWLNVPDDGRVKHGRIISNRGLDVQRSDHADPDPFEAGFGFGIATSESHFKVIFTFYGIVDVGTEYELPRDQWVHVAATISNTGDVIIYVDGVEQNTVKNLSPRFNGAYPHPGRESNQSLYIGQNPFSVAKQWQLQSLYGQVDELAIYTRVLTPHEIEQHVRTGRPE